MSLGTGSSGAYRQMERGPGLDLGARDGRELVADLERAEALQAGVERAERAVFAAGPADQVSGVAEGARTTVDGGEFGADRSHEQSFIICRDRLSITPELAPRPILLGWLPGSRRAGPSSPLDEQLHPRLPRSRPAHARPHPGNVDHDSRRPRAVSGVRVTLSKDLDLYENDPQTTLDHHADLIRRTAPRHVAERASLRTGVVPRGRQRRQPDHAAGSAHRAGRPGEFPPRTGRPGAVRGLPVRVPGRGRLHRRQRPDHRRARGRSNSGSIPGCCGTRSGTAGSTSTASACRSSSSTPPAWAGRCCAPATARRPTSSKPRPGLELGGYRRYPTRPIREGIRDLLDRIRRLVG